MARRGVAATLTNLSVPHIYPCHCQAAIFVTGLSGWCGLGPVGHAGAEQSACLPKANPLVSGRYGKVCERGGCQQQPPRIKPALALGDVGKGPPADHLGHQGAMKPLVLALGLRMVGPAVAGSGYPSGRRRSMAATTPFRRRRDRYAHHPDRPVTSRSWSGGGAANTDASQEGRRRFGRRRLHASQARRADPAAYRRRRIARIEGIVHLAAVT